MTAAPQTATKETAQPRPSFAEAAAFYLQPRVLIVLFLGFSAGLPLALSGSTLLFWAAEVGVDLKIIGLFALVGTPYTLKFLWAPIVDALDVPILARWLGRRRAWLLLTQILLMAAILFASVGIPLLSAGQDLLRSKNGVNNTYRRGDLNALDYRRQARFPATHKYFADWIAFRRSARGQDSRSSGRGDRAR